MTVHRGKRESPEAPNSLGWRMYVLRGECEEEASLQQVACEGASLRSIGCFLLIDAKESSIVTWHGSAAPAHIRKMAKDRAQKLALKPPQEMKFAHPESVKTSEV